MTDERVTIASDDCDAVDPFLSAFADGELFGADRLTVERHLVRCGRCRASIDAYREWGAVLRETVESAATRDLSGLAWPPASAPAALRQAPRLTPRGRLFYDVARWAHPWPVFAGAAALVALIIGVGLWRPAAPEPRVEIERLDAAGSVMVFTADGGRTAIIWLSETEERMDPALTPT
jgi:anti-sigma factor RsiW